MSDEPKDQAEKKIIIDEDWKTRVETEKEQLRRSQEEPTGPQPDKPEQEAAFPPASLSVLITSLGMQAMMALGLMATSEGGLPKPRLNEARHLIDTLAVLEEKTAGNRTPEESTLLDQLLHELRMGFVTVQQRAGK
jgi:hypothetical protein